MPLSLGALHLGFRGKERFEAPLISILSIFPSQSGELLTADQVTCRPNGVCPNGDLNECKCEPDLTGAAGAFIGDIITYQCNYTDGFCNYDSVGRLLLLCTEISNLIAIFACALVRSSSQSR